jgi:DNA-binding NtrC family response regulator
MKDMGSIVTAPGGERASRSESGRRISTVRGALVVEDDPAIRGALLGTLEDSGFHAIGVGTLAEARVRLSRSIPELLVLDLTLPDGFGADLLDELAERGNPPATLLVSAFGLAPIIAKRFDVELLRKPLDLDAFAEAAERVHDAHRGPRRS